MYNAEHATLRTHARDPRPTDGTDPRGAELCRPSVVVFDLDGTLVDTMPALADLPADVINRHHGWPVRQARSSYLATSGLPFHEQLTTLVPGDARNEAAAAEFECRKIGMVAASVPSEANVHALRRLRRTGRRLAISSNSSQQLVDGFVRRCPVPFDMALGWTTATQKGRGHFAEICSRLGCTTADLLFIGDSLADARLAEAADVAFVAKIGTFTCAHFRVEWPSVSCAADVSEFVQWIERVEAAL